MGKSSKPPKAPDPAETAAAQTASNKETAYWNAVLNNVNQITPYGNLTYEQTGGGKKYNMDAYNAALNSYNSGSPGNQTVYYDGQPAQGYSYRDGKYYVGDQEAAPNMIPGLSVQGGAGSRGNAPNLEDYLIGDAPPSFTSTIKLTPEQQAIYDSQTRAQTELSKLGEEQIGRIRNSVSTPYSYSGINDLYGSDDLNAARQRTEEALYSRLNPQFAQDEEALRTRLINQGIGQGSEAYNREFERFDKAKNDARMQAILAGGAESDRLFGQSLQSRNQGINEYNAQRNAPLNEYIGLTSGVQVQNPQFNSQGYQGAAPVDYAGLINQNYQNQLGAYNAKTAQGNATQGALFGLGGSLLGAAGSAGGFGNLFKGFL